MMLVLGALALVAIAATLRLMLDTPRRVPTR